MSYRDTPRSDLTFAVRVTGRVPPWQDLPAPTQHLLSAYFDAGEHGRMVWRASGHDHDFALWLAAISAEFTVRCGHVPADLTDKRWRHHYDATRSPAEAAQLDLHQRPIVRIDDDELVCPVCGAAGQICEEDRATRRHELSIHGARIVASDDDHLFEHDRYFCGSCDTTVQLPQLIDHYR